MNQTISMGHVPAVRASRALPALNVRKMCASAAALARRKSLTLAVISAAASYTGALVDSDPLTYAAAFAALAFVRLTTGKGGEA